MHDLLYLLMTLSIAQSTPQALPAAHNKPQLIQKCIPEKAPAATCRPNEPKIK